MINDSEVIRDDLLLWSGSVTQSLISTRITESLWNQGTLGSHMGPNNWQNGYYHQAQECPTSLRALDVMNCKIMDSHPWTPDFQGQQYQECPIWHTTRRQHLYFWWSHSKMYRWQRVTSHWTPMHLSIRSSFNFY